jgi:hypothetical protein
MRRSACLPFAFVLACNPKPSAPANDAEPDADGAPVVEAPDRCGTYVMGPDSLPPVGVCTSDADCAWTPHGPGSCCPPLCAGDFRAGSRAWVEAAESLYGRVCGPKADRWRCDCDEAKCLYRAPVRAECRNGRCEPVFE